MATTIRWAGSQPGRWTTLALCMALAACGSSSLGESHPRVSAAPLALQMIESAEAGITLHAVVTGFRPGDNLYYQVVPGPRSLIGDARPLPRKAQDAIDVQLTVRGDLEPGSHSDSVQLFVCPDAACESHYAGSPFSVPLQVTVLPNIYVQPEISLANAGDDPAPVLRVPVEVPADAGPVQVALQRLGASGNPASEALVVRLVDGGIEIVASKMPVGTYRGVLSIASASDPRRHAESVVTYVVSKPAALKPA